MLAYVFDETKDYRDSAEDEMKTIVLTALMVGISLTVCACQGLNSYQAYKGPCIYRAAEAGFCQEPSNFHISDVLLGRGG